ncbi:MAG TPA: hypothetical protein VFC63_19260 [Blastocatellia bacterium]|nr:hypothetical protein [Blastocatellia bacterium]
MGRALAPTVPTDGQLYIFDSATGQFVPAQVTEKSLSFSDNTTEDANTSQHGLAPKGVTGTSQFWRQDWTLANPTILRKSGVATRGGSTASGTQNIAHGLGEVPGFVRIIALYNTPTNTAPFGISYGTYNGSATTAISIIGNTNASSSTTDTTNIISLLENNTTFNSQVATITVDATNISLAWTRGSGGGVSGTIFILFEVTP